MPYAQRFRGSAGSEAMEFKGQPKIGRLNGHGEHAHPAEGFLMISAEDPPA
jgi:hypothetical protein